MAEETEVLAGWKYCDLKGDMTVTKMGDVVLVFLEDPSVNPEKDVLKFKDIPNGSREHVFKSDPQVDWKIAATQRLNLEVVAAFDEDWFKFTFENGFKFKNKSGASITQFSELDMPDEDDMPKMNPIVP